MYGLIYKMANRFALFIVVKYDLKSTDFPLKPTSNSNTGSSRTSNNFRKKS